MHETYLFPLFRYQHRSLLYLSPLYYYLVFQRYQQAPGSAPPSRDAPPPYPGAPAGGPSHGYGEGRGDVEHGDMENTMVFVAFLAILCFPRPLQPESQRRWRGAAAGRGRGSARPRLLQPRPPRRRQAELGAAARRRGPEVRHRH